MEPGFLNGERPQLLLRGIKQGHLAQFAVTFRALREIDAEQFPPVAPGRTTSARVTHCGVGVSTGV